MLAELERKNNGRSSWLSGKSTRLEESSYIVFRKRGRLDHVFFDLYGLARAYCVRWVFYETLKICRFISWDKSSKTGPLASSLMV